MSRASRRLNRESGRYMNQPNVTKDERRKRNSYYGNSITNKKSLIPKPTEQTSSKEV